MWGIFSRDSVKDFSYEITECPNYGFNERSLWKLTKGRKKVRNYCILKTYLLFITHIMSYDYIIFHEYLRISI